MAARGGVVAVDPGDPRGGRDRLLAGHEAHGAERIDPDVGQRAAAALRLVADVAGTTRDAVSVEMEIDGRPVNLVDTAGMEEAESEISQQSQAQANRASEEANIRLWCVDSSRDDFSAACQRLQVAAQRTIRQSVIDLWVATKADLSPDHRHDDNWIICSAVGLT